MIDLPIKLILLTLIGLPFAGWSIWEGIAVDRTLAGLRVLGGVAIIWALIIAWWPRG